MYFYGRNVVTARQVLISLFCVLALLGGTGCWAVRPPAQVKDPVPIFVADYGVHSSVLLPYAPGYYAEYSFADYAYGVEDHEMPWNVVGALFLSGQSSVGRVLTPVSPSDSVPPTYRKPIRIYRLDVEREKADRAVDHLEQRYQSARGPRVFLSDTQGFYGVDDQHYSILNTCNRMSADILRDAGCSVYGVPVISDFLVIRH